MSAECSSRVAKRTHCMWGVCAVCMWGVCAVCMWGVCAVCMWGVCAVCMWVCKAIQCMCLRYVCSCVGENYLCVYVVYVCGSEEKSPALAACRTAVIKWHALHTHMHAHTRSYIHNLSVGQALIHIKQRMCIYSHLYTDMHTHTSPSRYTMGMYSMGMSIHTYHSRYTYIHTCTHTALLQDTVWACAYTPIIPDTLTYTHAHTQLFFEIHYGHMHSMGMCIHTYHSRYTYIHTCIHTPLLQDTLWAPDKRAQKVAEEPSSVIQIAVRNLWWMTSHVAQVLHTDGRSF
jgi:hypothetical protein